MPKWIDIDEHKNTIRINNPVKGSRARIVRVSSKTIAMINRLQKTNQYIFNPHAHTASHVSTLESYNGIPPNQEHKVCSKVVGS
jgi:integrase